MLYRPFGKTNFSVSALGLGAMRLPLLPDNSAIDEPQAIELIRYAIDHGINYLDTAYVYHGGQSEIVVGKALLDGYRAKVKIATKLPLWQITSLADADRILADQLQKLQTDHLDFYLLHNIYSSTWPVVQKFDLISWGQKAVKSGKISHLGFSFHDNLPLFKEIIDATDHWDFCQIQYNYMDENYQAGKKGLEYAAARGVAVVIMEPLKGGKLAIANSQIQSLWDSSPVKRSPVEWSLQWIWHHPEVATVLSGMSNLDQLKQNLDSASRSLPGSLSPDDLALIQKVKSAYLKYSPIPCTTCKYCLPCPFGVNIPRNFIFYNDSHMFGFDLSLKDYLRLPDIQKASNCRHCGQCESHCPQKIPIRDWLAKINRYFP